MRKFAFLALLSLFLAWPTSASAAEINPLFGLSVEREIDKDTGEEVEYTVFGGRVVSRTVVRSRNVGFSRNVFVNRSFVVNRSFAVNHHVAFANVYHAPVVRVFRAAYVEPVYVPTFQAYGYAAGYASYAAPVAAPLAAPVAAPANVNINNTATNGTDETGRQIRALEERLRAMESEQQALRSALRAPK